MKSRGLVLLIFVTLGLGLVALFTMDRARPFAELPGTYQCENFGLPDAEHSRLRVDSDLKVIGIGKSHEFFVGTLIQKDEIGGEIDLSMATIHAPSFQLDPFSPIRIVGIGRGIHIAGKGPGGEFKVKCKRWN